MKLIRSFVLFLAFCFLANSALSKERPNILVVMVDDLGFSDIGCYGSEIETPNLDALAADGLRFNQFYNTAKCHSSRVSLLTGRYAYQAGNVDLSKAVTSAEVLGSAGYFTAMSGKWHLKKEPTDFGFQRYFGHLSGACNYFKGDNTFRLNGEKWNVPDKGFYTTVANVDYALGFLQEARETKKPWYLYIAFNAPHAPLQPLKEDYEKYEGKYDKGWDVMRAKRVAKMRELGLFPKDMKPSKRPYHIPAWKDLPKDRQDWEARRMAALAGMIDRVDQELGRVIKDLKKAGEFENTLILFVSDNGACPYDRSSPGMDLPPYHPDAKWGDSTGWASARNTPFQFFKQNQFEGGICTPGIVYWPAGLKWKKGSITDQPVHLIDVLPTLAEVGEATLPKSWPGRELEPVSGISFLSHLKGKSITSRPPIHFLFGADRGLRDGDWKLVSFHSEPWELYNIAKDRTELNDVAAAHPEMVKRMSKQWHDMTSNVLHAPQRNNTPVTTEKIQHAHAEWTAFEQELGPIGKLRTASKKKGKTKAKPPTRSNPGKQKRVKGIRARKDTSMKIDSGMIHLKCTGTDSGLAMDGIGDVKEAGPYMLGFQLKTTAGKNAEIYFSTDPEVSLPKGNHLAYSVNPNDQWQGISLKLETTEVIRALRVDIGDVPGTAVIKEMVLKDAKGKVVKAWP
ncbi:arylsulfatase [bacterium]|nr:arylsulfatase [bacterium]